MIDIILGLIFARTKYSENLHNGSFPFTMTQFLGMTSPCYKIAESLPFFLLFPVSDQYKLQEF